MAEINLLPWREQRREQEKKIFTYMLLIGFVGAAAIVFLIDSYSKFLVNTQTERNQILQKEITSLDQQIKEIKTLKQVRLGLISRMAIVQNLQSTRTMMVHLFDEMIKVVPLGIYIYKLERNNEQVKLWGYSESNTDISILMRNIENNVWMQTPVLAEIKKLEGSTQAANNDFSLTFTMKPKN